MFEALHSRIQTASNGLSEDAHTLSQSAIGGVTSLFKSGKRRRAGIIADGARGGIDNTAGAYTTPFSEEQTDWLAEVVGDSISHSLIEFGKNFAHKVEQRFIEAEKRIAALERCSDTSVSKIQDLEAVVKQLLDKVNTLQAQGTDAALKDRVAEMATALQAQRIWNQSNRHSKQALLAELQADMRLRVQTNNHMNLGRLRCS